MFFPSFKFVFMACRSMAVALCVLAMPPMSPVAAQSDGAPKKSDGKKDGSSLDKLPDWLGGPSAQYFRLAPFHLTVIRDGRVAGQVSLNVTVETASRSENQTIIEKRGQIHSAFLRDLHAVLSLDNGSGRAFSPNTVKTRLQNVADRLLGPGVIRAILIENVYTRNFDQD